MKLIIHKLVVKTYGDLIRERTKKLIHDTLLIFLTLFFTFWVEKLAKGVSFEILGISYRLDVLLFFILIFILILTTSILFLDLRNLLTILTQFIIKKFPRMNGNFGPKKLIIRDMAQILLLFLLFKPISIYLQNYSLNFTILTLSLTTLISLLYMFFCFVFIFDILFNLVKIINGSLKSLNSYLFAFLGKLVGESNEP